MTIRHPVRTWWVEIARVLRPHSHRELGELLMGPLPAGSSRHPELARAAAGRAGLLVADPRHERLNTVFYDIGAVVYFLRLVVWTVPDFSVGRYRNELLTIHDRIGQDGGFATIASRFLIEAVKPA